MRRCHHRELAGRHIAANGLHRNISVPENDTRHGLDLDILHGGALDFSEFADLILGETNIVHIPWRHFGDQFVD